MISPINSYYGHGKLLLTGEYFVLDGARALAIPTRQGQRLDVFAQDAAANTQRWTGYSQDGTSWLEATLDREIWLNFTRLEDHPTSRLHQLFHAAEQLKPGCTDPAVGQHFTTHLEFPRNWGLGSSSTLVHCLSEYFGVNPYALLERTFGGSGYDLACAAADGPIAYVRNGNDPLVEPTDWHPEWVDRTVFVYRNQKQDSRAGIRAYREAKVPGALVDEVTALTNAFSEALHLRSAAQILLAHEQLVARTLDLHRVQEEIFPDFAGVIKSLGAWGGDFVWALSDWPPEKATAYFNARGFRVVIPYNDMALPQHE